MHELITREALVQNEQYDYQGACPPEVEDTESAGPRSVVLPAVFEALSVQWWTSKMAWAYMNFNIYNWVTSIFSSISTGGKLWINSRIIKSMWGTYNYFR